jgi:hypothetical protein
VGKDVEKRMRDVETVVEVLGNELKVCPYVRNHSDLCREQPQIEEKDPKVDQNLEKERIEEQAKASEHEISGWCLAGAHAIVCVFADRGNPIRAITPRVATPEMIRQPRTCARRRRQLSAARG